NPPTLGPAGAGHDTGTADIVLPTDDFDLVPLDDSGATQQVTASQPAVTDSRTVVEPAAPAQPEPAPATAPAPAVRPGSGRSPTPATQSQAIPTPAMSRVKAAVQSGSSHAAATKKALVTAESRTAHPVMTAVMILTTVVLLYAASICSV